MKECITYIGLDVHKETIAVALAEGSKRGEVREYGQISNTPAALTRLSIKLSRPGSGAAVLLRGRAVRIRHPAVIGCCGA